MQARTGGTKRKVQRAGRRVHDVFRISEGEGRAMPEIKERQSCVGGI